MKRMNLQGNLFNVVSDVITQRIRGTSKTFTDSSNHSGVSKSTCDEFSQLTNDLYNCLEKKSIHDLRIIQLKLGKAFLIELDIQLSQDKEYQFMENPFK
jgi:hypothetical protein